MTAMCLGALVSEGGLEPPCPFGALAPQASASAYSATRTWLAEHTRGPLSPPKPPALPEGQDGRHDDVGRTYAPLGRRRGRRPLSRADPDRVGELRRRQWTGGAGG